MTRELKILRYGLILAPAVISIYIYDIDYDYFTLHILLLLLIAALGLRLPKPLILPAAVLELLFTSWLCYRYGALLIFPAIAAMLHYTRLKPRFLSVLLVLVHIAVLNAAFIHSPPQVIAYMNVTFLLAAALNELLYRTGRGREDTLFLYDELRKKHFELEEARNRLQQFTSQVENAAQAEERVRIARQLHDDIGHRLIRVKMMAEAAVHTLPVAPDAGMIMMGQIRDQLAASMDDMRAAVKKINYTPQLEGAYALDRLLEETGRDTGVQTMYNVQGLPYPLYPSLQIVLYKNAREAITNALRHGKATAVSISLTYSHHEICMEVGNNGNVPDGVQLNRLQSSGGMGLQGMYERTRLVGGSLALQADPGFCVITRLPVYRQGEIH
ncbi:two-component sensor histidine kinase [Paenibacillus sp. PK3_47]|uniref:sensor histidine kinase n=1 Tax=Paenibacillus sp. PK3_47 TaxID=2072642 RepID=UPI00201D47E3|nr:histidine kinase [Paenibacillus sp. PK3_47]UQZ33799.1 two-component sensor histidine kinase [Paenibacillus sp. PK3_47]